MRAVTSRQAQQGPRKTPFWREYERHVAKLVQALDLNATVKRDVKVRGEVSGVLRQLDALAEGAIAGEHMRVVVEAKEHARPVSIELVDGFVGKLLDLGAERGIFYAAGGFTGGARRRALKQRNPSIRLEHLKPVPQQSQPEMARLSRQPPTHFDYLTRVSAPPADPILARYREFLRGEETHCYE